MEIKKKFRLIFCFIFLITTVLIGYMYIDFVYQKNHLKQEISNLTTLDITKDSFNTGTVTHGDYKVVEETIKNYLNDYAMSLQKVNAIVSDEKFNRILSYDNLSTDLEFTNSIAYIDSTKEEFNHYMDNLIDKSKEETIKNAIKENKLSSYYENLYKDLMLNKDVSDKLNLSSQYLENYRDKINIKLDTCLEIFEFLKSNTDNYKFEDNEIKFATQDLINQYNSYIDKIKI